MTDYDTPKTGFMNPPEHAQFKKGKSGNPRGRPRKPKDLNTVLQQVLNRKVRIKDNERKMPIGDALIWTLRGLALQGDKQALSLQRRIIEEAGLAYVDRPSPEEKKIEFLRALEKMGVKVDWQR
ncbi:MAG: DUF5681 domain-containing protein [Tateyamaria sp.]|uniref:DUF5681 domain-containing protein n=1 Tax=Alphaproteobacteria TaxID=28211 RepID=UPI003298433A